MAWRSPSNAQNTLVTSADSVPPIVSTVEVRQTRENECETNVGQKTDGGVSAAEGNGKSVSEAAQFLLEETDD